MKHKKGDKIYIPSVMYISRGSDDRVGGLATISEVIINNDLPEFNRVMVKFEKFPGLSINYSYLLGIQDELKKEFGNKEAYPDPDIDTPWIESGDIVDGKEYTGRPIW